MPFYNGHQGSVKFNVSGGATTTVVQVTDWSITVEKQTYETTQITDTYTKRVGGMVSGSGNINLIYTGDNNNSFIEAVNNPYDTGNALFELFLSESDSKRIAFYGIITKATYGANRDEVSSVKCDFLTNGTITIDL
jgi:hypothetical protein